MYQVFVRGPRGETIVLNLCNTEEQFKSMTVRQLKEKILSRPNYSDWSPDRVRLIFTDKVLHEDERTLSEYGIRHMSVIMMSLSIPGGGSTPQDGMGEKDGRNRSQERFDDFSNEASSYYQDPS